MKYLLFILITGIFTACMSPEPRRPESVQTGSFIKESAIRNKELNKNERLQIESLIKKQPEKHFIASENGFWYHYKTKLDQDTITPQFGDHINFSYNIFSIDGTPIYTKDEIGNQDYIMDKEELFSGLREGLKLMKPTEEMTFIFPSQLAYGYYGDENKIGINVPLICDVTLYSITKKENND